MWKILPGEPLPLCKGYSELCRWTDGMSQYKAAAQAHNVKWGGGGLETRIRGTLLCWPDELPWSPPRPWGSQALLKRVAVAPSHSWPPLSWLEFSQVVGFPHMPPPSSLLVCHWNWDVMHSLVTVIFLPPPSGFRFFHEGLVLFSPCFEEVTSPGQTGLSSDAKHITRRSKFLNNCLNCPSPPFQNVLSLFWQGSKWSSFIIT